MAATTRIAALKDAVTDGLTARFAANPALATVQISSADLYGDTANESIALIGEDVIEQEWAQIGRFSRDEQITLIGSIYVAKPGKGEPAIRAARDRCIELMGEIEKFFTGTDGDPSVGGVVRSAMARPVLLDEQLDGDGKRVALLGFEIRSGKTRLQAT